MRIVVAVDWSDQAFNAVQEACALYEPKELTLVHAMDLGLLESPVMAQAMTLQGYDDFRKAMLDAGQQLMEQTAKLVRQPCPPSSESASLAARRRSCSMPSHQRPRTFSSSAPTRARGWTAFCSAACRMPCPIGPPAPCWSCGNAQRERQHRATANDLLSHSHADSPLPSRDVIFRRSVSPRPAPVGDTASRGNSPGHSAPPGTEGRPSGSSCRRWPSSVSGLAVAA